MVEEYSDTGVEHLCCSGELSSLSLSSIVLTAALLLGSALDTRRPILWGWFEPLQLPVIIFFLLRVTCLFTSLSCTSGATVFFYLLFLPLDDLCRSLHVSRITRTVVLYLIHHH